MAYRLESLDAGRPGGELNSEVGPVVVPKKRDFRLRSSRYAVTRCHGRDVEWIRFLFRQDLQDCLEFFRLRRGAFRPKAALS